MIVKFMLVQLIISITNNFDVAAMIKTGNIVFHLNLQICIIRRKKNERIYWAVTYL